MQRSNRYSKNNSQIVLGIFLTLGIFGFWLLFSTYFESFCRDDNYGGVVPIIIDQIRNLLCGIYPDRTYYLGGGGGLFILISFSGILDPFVFVPSLLIRDPHWLFNVIVSMHLAIFAAGGYYLALYIGAPKWANIVAGISLGFSGHFVIWAGNWITFLIPFAFLPWATLGLFGFIDSSQKSGIWKYGTLALIALALLFLTGGPFPPFYSGIAILFILISRFLEPQFPYVTSIKRLIFLAIIVVISVLPAILGQKEVFDHFGGRTPHPRDWISLSVPLSAYFGLFLPMTNSVWSFPWFAHPVVLTNLVIASGFMPAWFIVISVFLRFRFLLLWKNFVLVIGILTFIIILSPSDLGMVDFFAATPILNVFRWPFRAIPAFHFLVIYIFIVFAKETQFPISRLSQTILIILCCGSSIISFGYELSLMQVRDSKLNWYQELNASFQRSPLLSWYHTTPHLDSSESWDDSTLNLLRSAGYVLNVCQSEFPFHDKPRLFFYGNLGALFQVHTVGMYVVPYPAAYQPLGMTVKGCIRNLEGIRLLIEQGPKTPPPTKEQWDNKLGPANFMEIVRKTYVGAVIVDKNYKAAMDYFVSSENWKLIAQKESAVVFLRVH
jgi:hypothetical protein